MNKRLLMTILNENASLPTKAHATDSGFDLYAAEDVIIEPGDTVVVPTGIAIQLPEGCEAQVRPRSGVTAKTKLRVQLGTIDNGYNGDIGVIVDSIDDAKIDGIIPEHLVGIDGKLTEEKAKRFGSYLIRKGDRIAQLVVQYLPQVEAVEVDELGDETDRGGNGFGSTGTK
jgi:dUTP pyrophosphatase